MSKIRWSEVKSAATLDPDADRYYIEFPDDYRVGISTGNQDIMCILPKGESDADTTDFETNHKATWMKRLSVSNAPFAAKTIGGKNLFSRITGKKFTLTAGANTCLFTVPYAAMKFNGVEIVGCEAGDYVDLYVLDSTTGTYTTVPNYQLNQFGFTVYQPKDYYERHSNYDADLYINMQIKAAYNSVSAKDIYINYILHELK